MKIPELRRSEICRLVLERKRATVKGLASSLKVSEETIRRDINILYSRGYLVKVHGGVVAPDIPGLGTFERRSDHLSKEKLAIAKAARNLIKPGDSLMIDAGSTTNIFAEVMVTCKPLTVITNSLQVARKFWRAGTGNSVILLGGTLMLDTEETLGEIALEQISQFSVDHTILTVSGISETGQIMRYRIDEVMIARAMVRRAKKITILADHTKIFNPALMAICEMAEVTNLVTDRNPPERFVKLIKKSGTNLVVAKADKSQLKIVPKSKASK
jgi:DeoR family glycerol-3-phosphate regulon repressor